MYVGDMQLMLTEQPPAPNISSKLFDTEVVARQDFSAVVADIAAELEKSVDKSIKKVKIVCYNLTIADNMPLLSADDKEKIKHCNSIYDIFEVMSPHWSWNSHRLLFIIIKRVKSSEALELLTQYRKKIDYQMKIENIYKYCKQNKSPVPFDYVRMKAIIDKDYNDITLEEFSELEEFANRYLGINQCPFEVNPSQSIQVIWLISQKQLIVYAQKHFNIKRLFSRNHLFI